MFCIGQEGVHFIGHFRAHWWVVDRLVLSTFDIDATFEKLHFEYPKKKQEMNEDQVYQKS